MVSKDEMIAFFRSEFPKARYVIEDFTDDSVVVRHQVGEQDLRPGWNGLRPDHDGAGGYRSVCRTFAGNRSGAACGHHQPQLQFSEKASG